MSSRAGDSVPARKCHDCGVEAMDASSRCQPCWSRRQVLYRERYAGRYQGKYLERGRAKRRARIEASMCRCGGGVPYQPVRKRIPCATCGGLRYRVAGERRMETATNLAQYRMMRDIRAWADVLNAYGPRCACCGESQVRFLSVDHSRNDGHKDRAKNGKRVSGTTFYLRIAREGFPASYQILCMNCNWGKGKNGGVCPHLHTSALTRSMELVMLGVASDDA